MIPVYDLCSTNPCSRWVIWFDLCTGRNPCTDLIIDLGLGRRYQRLSLDKQCKIRGIGAIWWSAVSSSALAPTCPSPRTPRVTTNTYTLWWSHWIHPVQIDHHSPWPSEVFPVVIAGPMQGVGAHRQRGIFNTDPCPVLLSHVIFVPGLGIDKPRSMGNIFLIIVVWISYLSVNELHRNSWITRSIDISAFINRVSCTNLS